MSDYEDAYFSDDFSEEDETEEDEEETTDESEEEDSPIVAISAKKNLLSNGVYEFNKVELDNIKLEFLKKPRKFEIIGILETLIELYKSGAFSLIDEKKLGIELYNNFNIINEETASFIALKEKCTGLCVIKEGNLLNVDKYDDLNINYFIKYILRIYDNDNTIIRIDTLKQIYRDLDIYSDCINMFSL